MTEVILDTGDAFVLKLGHFWVIGVVCPSVLVVLNLTHRPVFKRNPTVAMVTGYVIIQLSV